MNAGNLKSNSVGLYRKTSYQKELSSNRMGSFKMEEVIEFKKKKNIFHCYFVVLVKKDSDLKYPLAYLTYEIFSDCMIAITFVKSLILIMEFETNKCISKSSASC